MKTVETKSNLMLSDLLNAKAKQVAILDVSGYLLSHDLTKPMEATDKQGFYFLVNQEHKTVARFYVGRQRTKSGMECVTKHIRKRRSKVCERIMDAKQVFDVYYIPTEKMKPLTTGYKKGKLASLVTKQHNDRYQNLEEMNRMLSDNFAFTFQRF